MEVLEGSTKTGKAPAGVAFEMEANVRMLVVKGRRYGRVNVTLPADFVGRRAKIIVIV